jgi:hypothetical protein
MLRRTRALLPLLGLLVLSTTTLLAQGRRGLVEVSSEGIRRGFWLAGGFGRGEESFRFADDPVGPSEVKPVFAFRMGGTPDQNLRIGGEFTTWVNPYTDDDGFQITETLSSLTVIGQFYPIRTAGLFIKGGVGIGATSSSVEFGNRLTETGFVAQYGAGYDIRLGRTLALTPTVEMFRHRFTKRGDDPLDERLFHIGVALTWQR